MPARKSTLDVVPHFQAVQLAWDTPLKREVVAHAERLMADRLNALTSEAYVNNTALQRANSYLEALNHKPVLLDTSAETPPRRDPNIVGFAQANRCVALGMAIHDKIDRLREECYRTARECAYQRTLKRVGPRFWPSEADAAGIPPDPLEERPQGQTAPEPVTTTEAAGPQMSPESAKRPDHELSELERSPVSNRILQTGQETMTRAGIPRQVQIELTRKAKQEAWTVHAYYAEVSRIVSEEKQKPVPV